jgi:hypothetical protein
MPYVNFTPDGLISKAMFDFEYAGIQNYKFLDEIKVSVSDGFSNNDYYLGLVNSTDLTMNPYSNEIIWDTNTINNLNSTFSVLAQFANLPFSSVTDYDSRGGGLFSICSPADVGIISDINISFMNANSKLLLGMSSGSSDLLGYKGSRGDIFINVTGIAFESEGVTFADFTKSRQILFHEIGHSLGLSHPFNDIGNVKPGYSTLTTAGFEKLGFNTNNGNALNKEYFSIMSYNDESLVPFINAYTPMILDIIALESVYGKGLGTTGGSNDTIIAGYTGYRSYFDLGGTDLIDLSIYINGAYLHMGTSITSASHHVGIITSLSDSENIFSGKDPSALRWLYGEYENAKGSDAPDLIIGNNLANSIYGNAGNDILDGGAGDDKLDGGAGNDTIDAGTGIDNVTYSRSKTNYTISKSGSTYTVTDKTGLEGTDTLTNIERLQFSDRTVALDINGTAGQAYRVYQAAFNRTPDNGGLKYWIGLMDGGVSLPTVSSAFIASAEFKALYGANPTNEVFISKLYDNVLHRVPDIGGYNYWVGLLNNKQIDMTSTLVNFSESPENQAGVIGVIQNGIELI